MEGASGNSAEDVCYTKRECSEDDKAKLFSSYCKADTAGDLFREYTMDNEENSQLCRYYQPTSQTMKEKCASCEPGFVFAEK